MNKFIQNLQNQPYEKRVRYLWLGTIAAGVIVVIAWGSLTALNLKNKEARKIENDAVLQDLQKNYEVAIDEFAKAREDLKKQFSQLEIPAEDERELLKLDSTALSNDKTKIAVNFTLENPTLDVLNVFTANHANVVLVDGVDQYSPEKVMTKSPEYIFPGKILSKQKISGYMVFPIPQNSTVTLNINNMFFESIPNETFTETLTIDLNSEVKGVITRPLPRQ
ncbi:MAG: hypothetical protein A2826_01900 [Candidatus Doudnabacteria bacterium RIFCSPHIGHO2_01_FULL_43_23]|uniref:DUF4352 domain-containing protein n=1 Tax=Candidatus Doudnabacteria bacterium RIFCSPHIGHO2_01_FULL_43_23 TaxID=1817822 RepID=A0A1F5NT32_9BACT|nr:MAG: hypothetical protein A2826_01900 [Candidatus Doudnabacteria bacterium RIFCSPHIGHO2_01_FULL_43_23]